MQTPSSIEVIKRDHGDNMRESANSYFNNPKSQASQLGKSFSDNKFIKPIPSVNSSVRYAKETTIDTQDDTMANESMATNALKSS